MHTSKFEKLAVFLFASSLAWAQSSPSAAQQDSPAQPQSANAEALPSALADSKSLEVLHVQKADYPLQAEQEGVQGEVVVKVQISETGDVELAKVVSGDPVLVDAAIRAAKKFKFKPYIRNGKPVKVSTTLPFDFYFRDKLIAQDTSADGTSKLTPSSASIPPGPPSASDPQGGSSAPRPVLADTPPKTVSVSAGVTQGLLIRKIAPVYPSEAKHNGIQGTVVLKAVIGKDGRIKDLRAVSGPKELYAASIGAVQQWQYRPYLLLGQPVQVDTMITVNFQLR